MDYNAKNTLKWNREKKTATKTITYGNGKEMWLSPVSRDVWYDPFSFSIPKEIFIWVETRREKKLLMYTIVKST